MRLSNKSTFSLVCFILLMAFVAMPAMAETITATWTTDRNNDNTEDDPGWRVTIGGLDANDDPTVTYLNPALPAAAATGTQAGFDAAAADATAGAGTSEGQIEAAVNTVIAVQVVVGAITYQRVTFPAGGEGATLAETTLMLLPKLMDLTTSMYYVSFNETVTVTFDFAAAVADTNDAPMAPLHRSDVSIGTPATIDIVSVSGTNMVTFRSPLGPAEASASSTVDLAAVFAQPADTATDGQATVIYDDTPPTITAGSLEVGPEPGYPEPADGVWNRTFLLNFSADDEDAGSGLAEDLTRWIVTDSTKLDVESVGLGTPDETPDDTEYLARITPKATRTTTAGEPVTITVMPTDKAGNQHVGMSIAVKLAAKSQPATAATIQTTALGQTMAGGTLTVMFDKNPGTVTVPSGYTITTNGEERTITVPATQGSGSHSIALTWSNGGSATVTYTIPAETVRMPTNLSDAITIPAESYVILVRNMNMIGNPPESLQDRFANILDLENNRVIPDANIKVWSRMPDLAELFDRDALGGGGALVLKKVADDMDAPDIGTVGISEIMWAIDAGYIGQAKARDSQWIELHNLNDTAKQVMIYAQTGAQFTNSDRLIVATQAGDTIHGNPGGMVVDVMTNYFTGSDRGNAGWDIHGSKGQNGSSKVGIDFVSMARKGTFDIGRQNNDKNNYTGLYTKTTKGQSGRDKDQTGSSDGRHPNSWESSTVRYDKDATDNPDAATTDVPAEYSYLGTPGRANTHSAATHITKDSRTDVPASPIIINEVANRDDVNNRYEWIELLNVKTDGDPIDLNNYQISILTGVDKDERFIELPNNSNAKIPPGGVLLLVDSDPATESDHPLAVGWKVGLDAELQVPGLEALGIHATSNHGRYLVVDFGGKDGKFDTGLPDDGNFILVVRSPDGHQGGGNNLPGKHGGEGRAELGKDDLGKITDIAGYASGLTKNNYTNAVSKTDLWPLKAQGGPDDKNRLSANKVRYRRNVTTRDGRAGSGNTHNDRNADQVAFKDVGYTGIGYKRQAADSGVHGGTPGYANNVLKSNTTDLAMDKLVISEIMLSQDNGGRTTLPQWIEIHNPSSTTPINLHAGDGWRLIIENPEDPIRTINFKGTTVKTVLPEQTVIIISGSTRSFGSDIWDASVVFPATRVLNVYNDFKNEFEMDSRTDPILNAEEFRMTLIDGTAIDTAVVTPTDAHLKVGGKYYTISDDVGNLDGNARTSDESPWKYPEGNHPADGNRSSLIRVFEDDGTARNGVNLDESNVLPHHAGGMLGEALSLEKGIIPDEYSWVQAFQLDFGKIRHTWYGDQDDIGTPLNRIGQILPVELSHFRPALENGEVVIRWTTESELDNAGFNILRSDTRNGEFKQVNAEMIQGNGTTGERNTYKWVDATAKPGVVYYYQIEDVSFAGERETLQTTKLKGYISAVGKATTTWGDIKEVQ